MVPLLMSQNSLFLMSLNGTQISDDTLKAVGKIKSLRLLSLSAKMSDKGIRELAHLDRLLLLDLTNADLPESALDVIGKMSSLSDISLAGTKVTDAGILKLVNLERLGMLDLTDTKVTTAGVQALVSRLPRLKVTR